MAEVLIFTDINGLVGFGRYAGPYRIATELRSKGFTVQVIEFFASLNEKEFKSIIDNYVDKDTLLIGLSSTFFNKGASYEKLIEFATEKNSLMQFNNSNYTHLFPQDYDFQNMFFDYIRTKNDKVKIVVGGHKAQNADVDPIFNNIDYWIMGQGESSIVALANHLKHGDFLSVAYTTNNSKILTDKMYPFDKFSDCKIRWEDNDHLFEGENVPIEIARGCIFKCSFCAFNLNGKKFGDYNKTRETLTDELIYNYENYGITNYMVSDDTLNDSKQKVNYLHKTITSLPFKVNLSAYCRLDIIGGNFETAALLKEMGLKSVNFGIETFHKKAAQFVGKGSNADKQKQILYDLKELWGDDVFMSAGFIIGLPFEPISSVRDTFDWLYSDDNVLSGVGLYRYYMEDPKKIEIKETNYDVGLTELGDKLVWKTPSKIRMDPKKYNYETAGTVSQWKHDEMDWMQAEELVNEFYKHPLGRQKLSMTYFQDFNRIKNLGFQDNEVSKMYYDNSKDLVKCIERKETMRSQYMEKVI